MKISIDDKEIFTLTEMQKCVICNDINEDSFYEDLCRRLQWIIMHKHEQCFKRLKDEWDEKLKKRVDSVPTNEEIYMKLVMSQKDYKSRKDRDKESSPHR